MSLTQIARRQFDEAEDQIGIDDAEDRMRARMVVAAFERRKARGIELA